MNVMNLGSRFHADPMRAYNLEGPWYYDPAIHAREQAAIFARSWNYVGPVGPLSEPGCYTTKKVAGENILIIRGRDGVLRGFYNVCQHRGHELVAGSGRKPVLACPYHAWTYDLDGRLHKARNSQDLPDFDMRDFDLPPVQVEVFCNFVFVNLDLEAPSFKSQTGDLEAEIRSYVPNLDRLVKAHEMKFDIKANWKNVVDNFLECYHCSVAHPAFDGLVEMPTYRSKTHGIYSSHTAKSGQANNEAYRFDTADPSQYLAAWWVWPDLTFIVFPGTENIIIMHMPPDGAEGCAETFEFFFESAEPSAAQTAAIDYTRDILNQEDIDIVESVQRGLHSRGYRQGRYVVDAKRSELSEHAVHHFHSLVLEALGE